MSTESQLSQLDNESTDLVLDQRIKGSRKISNYLVASMLSIGGFGFLLASLSSYFGKDFLPLGKPSTLIFIPQGYHHQPTRPTINNISGVTSRIF